MAEPEPVHWNIIPGRRETGAKWGGIMSSAVLGYGTYRVGIRPSAKILRWWNHRGMIFYVSALFLGYQMLVSKVYYDDGYLFLW